MEHIIILLDTSYSMTSHIESFVNSVNYLVKSLKNSGKDIYFTLACFDTNLRYITKFKQINSVHHFETYEFNIFGMTALYDSINKVLVDFKQNNGYMKQTLFIITDGEDNSSAITEFMIKDLCNDTIKYLNWNIIHCHTDVSKLNVKSVVFDINNEDDIANIFNNLTF